MAIVAGCNRSESNPTGIAKVYIQNEDGEPIQNALVYFNSPENSGGFIDVYKYSEIDGSAYMKWDYDTFVDVICTKGGYKGCTAIHIVPGQTNTAVLVLKQFDSQSNGCP